jgi:putative ABC transport system substrate-binding protein
LRALEEALRELGYVEGQNVSFERRFADGKPARLPELARIFSGSVPLLEFVIGGIDPPAFQLPGRGVF